MAFNHEDSVTISDCETVVARKGRAKLIYYIKINKQLILIGFYAKA